jgi:hypothetical protein
MEMGWDGRETERQREIKNKKVRQVLKKTVGKGKVGYGVSAFLDKQKLVDKVPLCGLCVA